MLDFEEEDLTKSDPNSNADYIQKLADSDGKCLSPIDLSMDIVRQLNLPQLAWQNISLQPTKMKLTNTGHTVILSAKWSRQRPHITGGPLSTNYVFSQIHFHWGADEQEGSEHTSNGIAYPLEMHAVFFKSVYLTQEAALKEKDGVLVVAYLFKVVSTANPSVDIITDALQDIVEPRKSVHIQPVPLSIFLEEFTNDFLLYWGGVQTHNCTHTVLWVISRRALGVSLAQLAKFRNLQDTRNYQLTRNFRDPQPLDIRTVFHANPSNDTLDVLLPGTRHISARRTPVTVNCNYSNILDMVKHFSNTSKLNAKNNEGVSNVFNMDNVIFLGKTDVERNIERNILKMLLQLTSDQKLSEKFDNGEYLNSEVKQNGTNKNNRVRSLLKKQKDGIDNVNVRKLEEAITYFNNNENKKTKEVVCYNSQSKYDRYKRKGVRDSLVKNSTTKVELRPNSHYVVRVSSGCQSINKSFKAFNKSSSVRKKMANDRKLFEKKRKLKHLEEKKQKIIKQNTVLRRKCSNTKQTSDDCNLHKSKQNDSSGIINKIPEKHQIPFRGDKGMINSNTEFTGIDSGREKQGINFKPIVERKFNHPHKIRNFSNKTSLIDRVSFHSSQSRNSEVSRQSSNVFEVKHNINPLKTLEDNIQNKLLKEKRLTRYSRSPTLEDRNSAQIKYQKCRSTSLKIKNSEEKCDLINSRKIYRSCSPPLDRNINSNLDRCINPKQDCKTLSVFAGKVDKHVDDSSCDEEIKDKSGSIKKLNTNRANKEHLDKISSKELRDNDRFLKSSTLKLEERNKISLLRNEDNNRNNSPPSSHVKRSTLLRTKFIKRFNKDLETKNRHTRLLNSSRRNHAFPDSDVTSNGNSCIEPIKNQQKFLNMNYLNSEKRMYIDQDKMEGECMRNASNNSSCKGIHNTAVGTELVKNINETHFGNTNEISVSPTKSDLNTIVKENENFTKFEQEKLGCTNNESAGIVQIDRKDDKSNKVNLNVKFEKYPNFGDFHDTTQNSKMKNNLIINKQCDLINHATFEINNINSDTENHRTTDKYIIKECNDISESRLHDIINKQITKHPLVQQMKIYIKDISGDSYTDDVNIPTKLISHLWSNNLNQKDLRLSTDQTYKTHTKMPEECKSIEDKDNCVSTKTNATIDTYDVEYIKSIDSDMLLKKKREYCKEVLDIQETVKTNIEKNVSKAKEETKYYTYEPSKHGLDMVRVNDLAGNHVMKGDNRGKTEIVRKEYCIDEEDDRLIKHCSSLTREQDLTTSEVFQRNLLKSKVAKTEQKFPAKVISAEKLIDIDDNIVEIRLPAGQNTGNSRRLGSFKRYNYLHNDTVSFRDNFRQKAQDKIANIETAVSTCSLQNRSISPKQNAGDNLNRYDNVKNNGEKEQFKIVKSCSISPKDSNKTNSQVHDLKSSDDSLPAETASKSIQNNQSNCRTSSGQTACSTDKPSMAEINTNDLKARKDRVTSLYRNTTQKAAISSDILSNADSLEDSCKIVMQNLQLPSSFTCHSVSNDMVTPNSKIGDQNKEPISEPVSSTLQTVNVITGTSCKTVKPLVEYSSSTDRPDCVSQCFENIKSSTIQCNPLQNENNSSVMETEVITENVNTLKMENKFRNEINARAKSRLQSNTQNKDNESNIQNLMRRRNTGYKANSNVNNNTRETNLKNINTVEENVNKISPIGHKNINAKEIEKINFKTTSQFSSSNRNKVKFPYLKRRSKTYKPDYSFINKIKNVDEIREKIIKSNQIINCNATGEVMIRENQLDNIKPDSDNSKKKFDYLKRRSRSSNTKLIQGRVAKNRSTLLGLKPPLVYDKYKTKNQSSIPCPINIITINPAEGTVVQRIRDPTLVNIQRRTVNNRTNLINKVEIKRHNYFVRFSPCISNKERVKPNKYNPLSSTTTTTEQSSGLSNNKQSTHSKVETENLSNTQGNVTDTPKHICSKIPVRKKPKEIRM